MCIRDRSEIYFRFRFWWWYSFGKMEVYWHTKFRWVISIHSWDKTTSGFEKQMAAILNFYFRLLFLPNFRHRRVILHWLTTFRQNWTTVGGVMTSYRCFSRWRPAAIIDLIWITLDHPRSRVATRPAFDGTSRFLALVSRVPSPTSAGRQLSRFLVAPCRSCRSLPLHHSRPMEFSTKSTLAHTELINMS